MVSITPDAQSISHSEAHPAVNRRAVLKSAAWTLPVIATAVATPLAAATTTTTPEEGTKTGLLFTDQGGSAQFGSGWGTQGDFEIDLGVRSEWDADPAHITVTVTHVSTGVSKVFADAYYLETNGQWKVNDTFNVPSWTPGPNEFFVSCSAPGFKTITTTIIINAPTV